jgi:hypothetical protein
VSLAVAAAFGAIFTGWLAYPSEPERILVGSFFVVAVALVATVGDVSGNRAPARTDSPEGPAIHEGRRLS